MSFGRGHNKNDDPGPYEARRQLGDLTQASILFGARVPLVIAAGLLGRSALHGGIAMYVLGVLLHFLIAFTAAAFYYVATRWLEFLKEHPLVCGLFYWGRR